MKSRNYHRRVNRILNQAVRRAERRDEQFFRNPGMATGRAKREAIAQARLLCEIAERCSMHFMFSSED